MAEDREIRSTKELRLGRLDKIFELVKQGESSDQVERHLGQAGLDKVAPPPTKDEVLWSVGKEAVSRVEEALLKHPRYFSKFRVSQRWDPEDMEGKDIIVSLAKPVRLPDFDEFYIEVKASQTGVTEFRRERAQVIPEEKVKLLGLERAIDEYLFSRKMIVIEAGLESDTDLTLMREFNRLHGYWVERAKGHKN